MKYNVAILGATGLVGETIIEILAERNFPIDTLYPLASARSAGDTVSFNGEDVLVTDAEEFDWSLAHIVMVKYF